MVHNGSEETGTGRHRGLVIKVQIGGTDETGAWSKGCPSRYWKETALIHIVAAVLVFLMGALGFSDRMCGPISRLPSRALMAMNKPEPKGAATKQASPAPPRKPAV